MGQAFPSESGWTALNNPIQEYLMKGNGPGRPVWYTPASVQQPNPSWDLSNIQMGQASPSESGWTALSNPIQEYHKKGNGPSIPVWYTPARVQHTNPSWFTYTISISQWARHPRLSLAGKHSATHFTITYHTGRAHPCFTQVQQT